MTKMKFSYLYIIGLIYMGLVSPLFAQDPTSGTEKPSPLNRGRIVPSIVQLETGGQQQFQIVMEATRLTAAYNPMDVEWSVNGVVGGNNKVGTITSEGLYNAPIVSSVINEVYVTGLVETADNSQIIATVLLNGNRPEYSTIYEFSEQISPSSRLDNPTAIAIDQKGNYLITNKDIMRYSSDGTFIESFGKTGKDLEGYLIDPVNVAVDNRGYIFVSDNKITAPRIVAFSSEGEYLYSFGSKGAQIGMTLYTRGMAFNSKNRMYLGDVELSRVNIYDNLGEHQFYFGKEGYQTGEFNGYYDLALDINDDVFIANYFGPCQKFDAYGRYLYSFASPDPQFDGGIYTTDIATDSWGNVYVIVRGKKNNDGSFDELLDSEGDRVNIVKYNNNGDFITNIQLSSKNRDPIRLSVDNEDRLVVLFKSDKKVGVEVLANIR